MNSRPLRRTRADDSRAGPISFAQFAAALADDGFGLRVRRVDGRIWFTYTNVVLVAST